MILACTPLDNLSNFLLQTPEKLSEWLHWSVVDHGTDITEVMHLGFPGVCFTLCPTKCEDNFSVLPMARTSNMYICVNSMCIATVAEQQHLKYWNTV